MRQIAVTIVLLTLSLLTWQCEEPVKGTAIQGEIQNATNLQVFLDAVEVGKASNVMASADIGENGQFKMEFPEGIEPGPYQLRIGAKKVTLFMDGSEKVVQLNGDLNNLQIYDFTISGAPKTASMLSLMQKVYKREVDAEGVKTYIDTVSDARLGALVSFQIFGTSGQFLEEQKAALDRMKKDYPNSRMIPSYMTMLNAIEQQVAKQQATQLIQEGMEAPDISLPAPDGKEYKLSDLRGKIVLLDFWASWCGPCRRENPNVVKVYDEYKNQGFTVFSVSLDGMDSRTRERMTSDTQAEAYMQNQKQRWVDAIEQDNLKWEYHVSDLKKWESVAAAKYGVRSIPRAFIIDRDGKIASVGVRGAEQIEQEVKKLLAAN